MRRDAAAQRGHRPFVLANLKYGDGVEKIVEFLCESGGLLPAQAAEISQRI